LRGAADALRPPPALAGQERGVTILERRDYSFGVEPIGRILLIVGLVLLIVGALLTFSSSPRLDGDHSDARTARGRESVPGLSWLGRLPGDVRVERPGFRLYVPITTSLLLSAVLSLLLYVASRMR
jgi:hypothetical protein